MQTLTRAEELENLIAEDIPDVIADLLKWYDDQEDAEEDATVDSQVMLAYLRLAYARGYLKRCKEIRVPVDEEPDGTFCAVTNSMGYTDMFRK